MDKKKCSYCGEEIKAYEGRCPYCGSLVDTDPQGTVEELPDLGVKENQTGEASKEEKYVPSKKLLSNGFKVFLTTFCMLVPGLGQLIGLIAAIVFMNSEEDADKKSFGLALMIASLVVFAITLFFYSLLGMLIAFRGL